MKISLVNERLGSVAADLLAVPTRKAEAGGSPAFDAVLTALGDGLAESIKLEGFTAGEGQLLRVPSRGTLAAKAVLVVGLGAKPSAGEVRNFVLRSLQGAKSAKAVAVVLPDGEAETIRVAAETARTATYRYAEYKTGDRKPKTELENVLLVAPGRGNAAQRKALEQGVAIGEAVVLVRDLVNAPPNDLNAVTLADAASKAAAAAGVACEVLGKKKLEKLGMRLFLAVNQGSEVEPRLVHLRYVPAKKPKKKVVFVGKGLTFDSGGLCIKPAGSMVTMKCDMAGAATTLGIVLAAARLELPIEVHGLLGCTDNMTGGNAYRPGDVFTSLEGKTVEIINTDAEGRLVLADVLTYAARLEPDYMIDHATLTGACMVALGPYRAGFFANDEELASRYLAAAEKDGEAYFRLPLDEELRSMLDSDIADMKHVGGQYGGTITAALFLREFIGKTRWAHVDIAGPAFLDRPLGRYPKGGTGFGVGSAVRFLEALAHKPKERG